MILSYSHSLKQWVRLCENHKEVRVLWNCLTNGRLMIINIKIKKGSVFMKEYLVKIKTDMIVVSDSKENAILSVKDLLKKCVEEKIDLTEVFVNKYDFIFEAEELKNEK